MNVLHHEAQIWEGSVTPTKTAVDILRDPIVILDQELCVVSANGPFYRTFQVDKKDTEGKLFSELGDGQWGIPALEKSLREIGKQNIFLKAFEVDRIFPKIGRRVFILNARQIYQTKELLGVLPPRILVALEDVTQIFEVAKVLAGKASFR